MTALGICAVVAAIAVWAAGRAGWIDQGDLYAASSLAVVTAGVGWWLMFFPNEIVLAIVAAAVGTLAVFAWRALALGVAALAVGAAGMFALIYGAGVVDVDGPTPDHIAPAVNPAEVAATR